MPEPALENLGYGKIDDDLRRLKKYRLETELETLFKIVNNAWMEHGVCIDENRKIWFDDEVKVYKRRVPINGSSSGGARIVYAILRGQAFIPLLLFLASEEPKYPLQVIKRIIRSRLHSQ